MMIIFRALAIVMPVFVREAPTAVVSPGPHTLMIRPLAPLLALDIEMRPATPAILALTVEMLLYPT